MSCDNFFGVDVRLWILFGNASIVFFVNIWYEAFITTFDKFFEINYFLKSHFILRTISHPLYCPFLPTSFRIHFQVHQFFYCDKIIPIKNRKIPLAVLLNVALHTGMSRSDVDVSNIDSTPALYSECIVKLCNGFRSKVHSVVVPLSFSVVSIFLILHMRL